MPRPGWSRVLGRSQPHWVVPLGIGGAGAGRPGVDEPRIGRADAGEPRVGAPGVAELLVGDGLEAIRVGGTELGVVRRRPSARASGAARSKSPGSGSPGHASAAERRSQPARWHPDRSRQAAGQPAARQRRGARSRPPQVLAVGVRKVRVARHALAWQLEGGRLWSRGRRAQASRGRCRARGRTARSRRAREAGSTSASSGAVRSHVTPDSCHTSCASCQLERRAGSGKAGTAPDGRPSPGRRRARAAPRSGRRPERGGIRSGTSTARGRGRGTPRVAAGSDASRRDHRRSRPAPGRFHPSGLAPYRTETGGPLPRRSAGTSPPGLPRQARAAWTRRGLPRIQALLGFFPLSRRHIRVFHEGVARHFLRTAH